MNVEFWIQTWEKNKTGFHESKPNRLLVRHFNELNLAEGSRIFIPLCGKTLDIAWLLSKGYQVVGSELSKLAIEQLYIELGVEPEITKFDNILRYSAKNIDIFVGDFFKLSNEIIGSIDAIYDRAALVALPEKMRNKYTKHLLDITDTAKQLLITFEYDQSLMEGPPFSLNSDEVNRFYKSTYSLDRVESVFVPGGLKGICEAVEHVWILKSD